MTTRASLIFAPVFRVVDNEEPRDYNIGDNINFTTKELENVNLKNLDVTMNGEKVGSVVSSVISDGMMCVMVSIVEKSASNLIRESNFDDYLPCIRTNFRVEMKEKRVVRKEIVSFVIDFGEIFLGEKSPG